MGDKYVDGAFGFMMGINYILQVSPVLMLIVFSLAFHHLSSLCNAIQVSS